MRELTEQGKLWELCQWGLRGMIRLGRGARELRKRRLKCFKHIIEKREGAERGSSRSR